MIKNQNMDDISFKVSYGKCKCTQQELEDEGECFCGANSPYIRLCEEDLDKCIQNLVDPDEVVIHKNETKVLFGYPFRNPEIITLTSSSDTFTRKELAIKIAKMYQKIYSEESPTNMKWGIWGHCLSDLDLAGLELDGDHYILSIDS